MKLWCLINFNFKCLHQTSPIQSTFNQCLTKSNCEKNVIDQNFWYSQKKRVRRLRTFGAFAKNWCRCMCRFRDWHLWLTPGGTWFCVYRRLVCYPNDEIENEDYSWSFMLNTTLDWTIILINTNYFLSSS